MYRRCAAVGLLLAGSLSLSPGQASGAALDARPLQLALADSFSPPARANSGPELRVASRRAGAPSAGRRETAALAAEQSLRQRALQSMLNAPDPILDESVATSGPSAPQFRFERKGSAVRDFSRGYKEVCAKVARQIWDEPNGRKIKFDIAGKPGVGIEIPIR